MLKIAKASVLNGIKCQQYTLYLIETSTQSAHVMYMQQDSVYFWQLIVRLSFQLSKIIILSFDL